MKTSDRNIYIGAKHVKKVDAIAIYLTNKHTKIFTRQSAARFIIDSFKID